MCLRKGRRLRRCSLSLPFRLRFGPHWTTFWPGGGRRPIATACQGVLTPELASARPHGAVLTPISCAGHVRAVGMPQCRASLVHLNSINSILVGLPGSLCGNWFTTTTKPETMPSSTGRPSFSQDKRLTSPQPQAARPRQQAATSPPVPRRPSWARRRPP